MKTEQAAAKMGAPKGSHSGIRGLLGLLMNADFCPTSGSYGVPVWSKARGDVELA
ncbi:MAG: hypothetical protein HOI23_18970 [Deltaproteobacteria bacterium]|jgi:hypothetical protein|nr:hypothetical protein [Deltaproteobacteria bacterium]MBT6433277.1 hypothetical protein [Deltaproteobacteria bacterium]MBT6492127.1 hypothetical protein [Deltaproteobacteria bacterium]